MRLRRDAIPGRFARGCLQARISPHGFARIIDISDETYPKLVSKLMLEVNDPANCAKMADDFPAATSDLDNYGYSSHYCTPDTPTDPKILACGYWGRDCGCSTSVTRTSRARSRTTSRRRSG